MSGQIVMVSLEDLVSANHIYRKFANLWDFSGIHKQLSDVEKDNNYKGYGAVRLFKCLLLQFLEDFSDRELERYLQENVASKWFCNFELTEPTPDHTVFGRIRSRIGTTKLSKPKVAFDKEARIGCKGKDKYWYGYKKHVCVDMQSGLINKIAITPGNVMDSKGLENVCPDQGAIYADKAYCTELAKHHAAKRQCHLAAIKKNNMKGKNKDKDRWYSGIRAPYERVFSQQNKRTRYCGVVKNQFAGFMEAICFNLKRLTVLGPLGLVLA